MKRKLVVLSVLVTAIFAFTAMASAAIRIVGPGSTEYDSISQAVSASSNGDTILVKANKGTSGTRGGATVSKNVVIKPYTGHTITINSGPTVPNTGGKVKAGIYIPSTVDGPTIQGFKFTTVQFPIYGVNAHKVSILGNTFSNPVQGITNWGGSNWAITSNTITGVKVATIGGVTGGGIGIFVGSKTTNQTVTTNSVRYNKITGVVTKAGTVGSTFQASGITIMAVFAKSGSSFTGPTSVTKTTVSNNTVGLTSTPTTGVVHALELTQLYRPNAIPSSPKKTVSGNSVINNVVTKTTGTKVVTTPSVLASWNTLTNNKSGETDLELDEVTFDTDDDGFAVNPF